MFIQVSTWVCACGGQTAALSVIIYLFFLIVWEIQHKHEHQGQRILCGGQISSTFMLVLGVELKFPGLNKFLCPVSHFTGPIHLNF